MIRESLTGAQGLSRNGNTTVVAEIVYPAMADRLALCQVPFRRVDESNWFTDLLEWLAGPLIFLGLGPVLSRGMAGAAAPRAMR
jgi:hypothetical protein